MSPTVTEANVSIDQEKSITLTLTPSITQTERPTDLNTTIIAAAIFAAVVLLVAVTIALMMAMLSSRSCSHRSHKNKLTDEHTAGPSNSFLFTPTPPGIVNGTFNRLPAPGVTTFIPVNPQPQLSTNDDDDYDHL